MSVHLNLRTMQNTRGQEEDEEDEEDEKEEEEEPSDQYLQSSRLSKPVCSFFFFL